MVASSRSTASPAVPPTNPDVNANSNTNANIGDLFAPPKVFVPVKPSDPEPKPKPEPEKAPPTEVPVEETPRPPLRLVGFVGVEELKALLTVDGKLSAIEVGESVDGVQVVAIAPPLVTLKHGHEEFKIDLMEEPFLSDPGASGGPTRAPRGPPTPLIPPGPRKGGQPGSSLRNNATPPVPKLPDSISNKEVTVPPVSNVTPPPPPNPSPPQLPASPKKRVTGVVESR